MQLMLAAGWAFALAGKPRTAQDIAFQGSSNLCKKCLPLPTNVATSILASRSGRSSKGVVGLLCEAPLTWICPQERAGGAAQDMLHHVIPQIGRHRFQATNRLWTQICQRAVSFPVKPPAHLECSLTSWTAQNSCGRCPRNLCKAVAVEQGLIYLLPTITSSPVHCCAAIIVCDVCLLEVAPGNQGKGHLRLGPAHRPMEQRQASPPVHCVQFVEAWNHWEREQGQGSPGVVRHDGEEQCVGVWELLLVAVRISTVVYQLNVHAANDLLIHPLMLHISHWATTVTSNTKCAKLTLEFMRWGAGIIVIYQTTKAPPACWMIVNSTQ